MGKENKYSKQQIAVLDTVYNTLKEAGWDDYSIAGVLGNALQESTLNPDSVSESGNYHGLFLNQTPIRRAIENQYGDYSLNSQLKYLIDWANGEDWIRKGKYASYTTTGSGKYKTSGYKDARSAGEAFMKLYERPVIVQNGKIVGYQESDKRLANSDLMHGYINDNYILPTIKQASDNEAAIYNTVHPDALKVNQVVPESQVKHPWDGYENISPYLTGKPMLRLQPRVLLPNLLDVMQETLWQPTFNINPRL